jgi:hypothetical protein
VGVGNVTCRRSTGSPILRRREIFSTVSPSPEASRRLSRLVISLAHACTSAFTRLNAPCNKFGDQEGGGGHQGVSTVQFLAKPSKWMGREGM